MALSQVSAHNITSFRPLRGRICSSVYSHTATCFRAAIKSYFTSTENTLTVDSLTLQHATFHVQDLKNRYHILNGDSLKVQFPEQISGELIIARECLVDGNVQGKTLEEVLETRSIFMASNYDGLDRVDYYHKSGSEFIKLESIPVDSEINLWFEWDLFCQVNFWFVMHILSLNKTSYVIHYVQPKKGSEYSFGHMTDSELITAYQNRLIIEKKEIAAFSLLWTLYQDNGHEGMLEVGKDLSHRYPHLLAAIKAHIDRSPIDGNPGRVIQSLIDIVSDIEIKDFGPVFKEFCKREGIYGFGDRQVKRLLEQLPDRKE